jgi:hypothetical protein
MASYDYSQFASPLVYQFAKPGYHNAPQYLTVTVSNDFLYGQNNKNGSRRFLVYHEYFSGRCILTQFRLIGFGLYHPYSALF